MDNTIEIHDGDFHLRLCLDTMHTFPAANFRLCLRLMRGHPEEMSRLGEYLEEQLRKSRADWDAANLRYTDEWKLINPRSRSEGARKTLENNRRLKEDLQAAKALHGKYIKLFEIYKGGS